MPELLAPGVYFESVDRGRGGIRRLPTDVAAFIGIAERGPLDEAVALDSWAAFRARFGGPLANGFLAYAAKAFFENGGRRAFFVRVAADSVFTASLGPQPADRRTTIVASVAGFLAGAVATVEQGGVHRNHLIAAVDPLGNRLSWEAPLEPELNIALPFTVATGVASATTTLLDATGRPTLAFEARDPGAWGNEIEVRLALSHRAATASLPLTTLDRSTLRVASVTGFALGTLVRLLQENPLPVEVHRIVTAVDAAAGTLTFDSPLPAAFDLASPLARPISLESLELGLTVLRHGRVEEIRSGLGLSPQHAAYIESALATSNLVRVMDLQREDSAATPWPARLPVSSRALLTGGRDGIRALTAARFIGESGADLKRGLRTLERVDEVSLVAIPDLFVRPVPVASFAPRPAVPCDPCIECCDEPPAALPLPPPLLERAPDLPLEEVYDAQAALVLHCETQRDRIALLDPPPFSPGEPKGISAVRAWRQRFDSSFAALYFPWVRIADPLPGALERTRELPPSAHATGVIARTDLARGVHKAPANEELRWVTGLAFDVAPAEQEILNPEGINCLRAFPGRGLRVYGARTLSSNSQLRYLPVRRLLLWIGETLEESLAWAVFEPHTQVLRQAIALSIESFLSALWAAGALTGSRASEAYTVRCNEANNPQDAIDRGELLAEVGVAPTVPAEFVVLSIGRTKDSFVVLEEGEG